MEFPPKDVTSFSLAAAVVLGVVWTSAASGSDYEGNITSINANGGKAMVTLANGSGASYCPAGPKFYLDPNVACDKAMLSLALTAKATRRLVYVSGTNTCESAWPYDHSQQLTSIDLKRQPGI